MNFTKFYIVTFHVLLYDMAFLQHYSETEVYKCIHELCPRYRHGMFSQKSRAYDYRGTSQY